MAIQVKGHRRGKSIIKAYIRAASVTSQNARGKSSYDRASKLRQKLALKIRKKVAIGNILLNRTDTSLRRADAGWLMGDLRYKATRKY